MQITATDSAFKRVKHLIDLQSNDNSMLRIIVNSGGCSGFMYEYEFVTEYTSEDYIIEQDGVKIIIDQLSQQYMTGCVIDFVEELGNSYFNIKNPSAISKCGCGNSFSV